MSTRKLRVFLCHATEDKPAVRKLYASLKSVPWIDPWLDEENLLPGQDWDLEIYKATRDADVIIICLSKVSVVKEGYLNKEIRHALEISQEKPEGAIYIIPLRLDDCKPSFRQLNKYQWADYFTPNAHERLLKSLSLRAQVLGINVSDDKVTKPETEPSVFPAPAGSARYEQYDLYRFIEIEPQKNSKVTYPFWIGKYPITNAQYERFLNAPDFASKIYWLEFPKFDENCQSIGDWGDEGVNWLKEKLKKDGTKKICPRQWDHEHLGKPNKHNPVVGITWFEANAYCEWLLQNWDSEPESKANGMLKPRAIRLPLETEWTTAAGGEDPNNRYPWDEPGKTTSSLKEVLRRANVRESEIEHTTPVTAYPLGKSPFSLMDMAGNVWEWQANNVDEKGMLALRGGAWHNPLSKALITSRDRYVPYGESGIGIGFRVMVIAK